MCARQNKQWSQTGTKILHASSAREAHAGMPELARGSHIQCCVPCVCDHQKEEIDQLTCLSMRHYRRPHNPPGLLLACEPQSKIELLTAHKLLLLPTGRNAWVKHGIQLLYQTEC